MYTTTLQETGIGETALADLDPLADVDVDLQPILRIGMFRRLRPPAHTRQCRLDDERDHPLQIGV